MRRATMEAANVPVLALSVQLPARDAAGKCRKRRGQQGELPFKWTDRDFIMPRRGV
jgi:hypothetical protein